MTLQAACSRLASVDDFRAAECGCRCTLDPTTIAALLDDASDLVYTLSQGRFFGVCEGTVRPCRTCWCGVCNPCCHIEIVPLRQDAIAITEVLIDGDVLAPENYRLLSRGRLQKISTDGEPPERWPYQQKMYLDLTEAETFGITYTFGQAETPAWVKNAVVELACDMATHFQDGRSKLPSGVTAATYQNTTITLPARADALRDGTTMAVFPAVTQLLSLTGGGHAYSPQGATAWSFL